MSYQGLMAETVLMKGHLRGRHRLTPTWRVRWGAALTAAWC